jgi:hypothetical protein
MFARGKHCSPCCLVSFMEPLNGTIKIIGFSLMVIFNGKNKVNKHS